MAQRLQAAKKERMKIGSQRLPLGMQHFPKRTGHIRSYEQQHRARCGDADHAAKQRRIFLRNPGEFADDLLHHRKFWFHFFAEQGLQMGRRNEQFPCEDACMPSRALRRTCH